MSLLITFSFLASLSAYKAFALEVPSCKVSDIIIESRNKLENITNSTEATQVSSFTYAPPDYKYTWTEDFSIAKNESMRPTAEQIKEIGINPTEKLSSPQTYVKLDSGDNFIVTRVNQHTGKVTLRRIKFRNAKKKKIFRLEGHKTIFIEDDPPVSIQINGENLIYAGTEGDKLVYKGIDVLGRGDHKVTLALNPIEWKKGTKITDSNGMSHTIVSEDSNWLAHEQETELDWFQFQALKDNKRIKTETPNPKRTSGPSFLEGLANLVRSRDNQLIKRVGKENVKLIRSEATIMSFMESAPAFTPEKFAAFISEQIPSNASIKFGDSTFDPKSFIEHVNSVSTGPIITNFTYDYVLSIPGKSPVTLIREELRGKVRWKYLEKKPAIKEIYEINLGVGKKHQVEVEFPDGEKQGSENIRKATVKLLESLPLEHAKSNDRIVFHRAEGTVATTVEVEGIAATAGQTIRDNKLITKIDFYKGGLNKSQEEVYQIFWHETGHNIAYKLWGTATPTEKWAFAVSRDKFFVSAYSSSNLEEDFAETVRMYIASDGGKSNPELRRKLAARFEVLDEIMNVPEHRILIADEIQKSVTKHNLHYWWAGVGATIGISSLGAASFGGD